MRDESRQKKEDIDRIIRERESERERWKEKEREK